jgi:hypothetical protein
MEASADESKSSRGKGDDDDNDDDVGSNGIIGIANGDNGNNNTAEKKGFFRMFQEKGKTATNNKWCVGQIVNLIELLDM